MKPGDLIEWDLLPDGDVLIVRRVQGGNVLAQRGSAEWFHFDELTEPQPRVIESGDDEQ